MALARLLLAGKFANIVFISNMVASSGQVISLLENFGSVFGSTVHKHGASRALRTWKTRGDTSGGKQVFQKTRLNKYVY